MSPSPCPECRRPLLVSDGFETCCHRFCGEYGKPVDSENKPHPARPAADRAPTAERKGS